jgi:hypothetical protein
MAVSFGKIGHHADFGDSLLERLTFTIT